MLQPIFLPDHIEITDEREHEATFVIHPYHPGYGPTVGNALRRVLLSSLPGAAITHMKIDGVSHEFTALDGMKEDLVTLILNLKQVRLTSRSEEPIEIKLSVKGAKAVTAGDFKTPPEITIANPDLPLATLTDKKATLVLTCTVEQGRGYVPSETREREIRDIGTVAIDAIFTPVQRVSFQIENARVGQATDYHKLYLTISTDGTITPQEALRAAASILRDHFTQLAGNFEDLLTAERAPELPIEEAASPTSMEPENTLSLLQLPARVHNALERVGITTVEQVLDLTTEQIQDVPGLGEKAVADILKARDDFAARSKGLLDDQTSSGQVKRAAGDVGAV